MNDWKKLGCMTLAVTLFFGGAAWAGPIKARQKRQDVRIDHGVATGALTRGEAAALEGQQKAIDRKRNKALANDGRIGPKEARSLKRAQNAASKNIARTKHNKRKRK